MTSVRAMLLAVSLACPPLGAQARFDALPRMPPGTYGLGVDFDGDFDTDFVSGGGTGGYLDLNDGAGRFQRFTIDPTPGARSGLPIVGDFDRDGRLDVFLVRFDQAGKPSSLHFGDGRGGFSDVTGSHFSPPNGLARLGLTADVDGDGDLDIVLANWLLSADRPIYLNDGTGHFAPDPSRAFIPPSSDLPTNMRAADFDADGDVDLIILHDGGAGQTTRTYVNDGRGTYTVGQFLGQTDNSCFIVDLEGDGDLDIGIGPYNSTLWENDGSGRFTDVSSRLPTVRPRVLGFGDLEGDGDPDLVIWSSPTQVGNRTVVLYQYANDGTGHFTDVTAATMPDTGNLNIGPFQLGDFDDDGDVDLVTCCSRVTLWNLTRQTYAPAPPRLGQGYTVEFWAGSGHTIFPAASFGLRRQSLGIFGSFGLDPATFVAGPAMPVSAAGKVSLTLPVPNGPNLLGVEIYWQAVDFDPAAPYASRTTNVFPDRFER